jgi:hypothetical protein
VLKTFYSRQWDDFLTFLRLIHVEKQNMGHSHNPSSVLTKLQPAPVTNPWIHWRFQIKRLFNAESQKIQGISTIPKYTSERVRSLRSPNNSFMAFHVGFKGIYLVWVGFGPIFEARTSSCSLLSSTFFVSGMSFLRAMVRNNITHFPLLQFLHLPSSTGKFDPSI